MFNRAIERVSGLSVIDRSVMWCMGFAPYRINNTEKPK